MVYEVGPRSNHRLIFGSFVFALKRGVKVLAQDRCEPSRNQVTDVSFCAEPGTIFRLPFLYSMAVLIPSPLQRIALQKSSIAMESTAINGMAMQREGLLL